MWQKLFVAKYSTQKLVKQIFVKHHAQVYLHQIRWNKNKFYKHLFKFTCHKNAGRDISTRLSISQEPLKQPKYKKL